MSSDELALLAAICANPSEDTPRLMYADWLDETAGAGAVPCHECHGHGEYVYGLEEQQDWCRRCDGTGSVPDVRAARAEFIRVQCELAVNWADHSDLSHQGTKVCIGCELRRRERELLKDWRGLLRSAFSGAWDFGRGGDNQFDATKHGSPRILFSIAFVRGFPSSLTCTAADFLAHADALTWHPEQMEKCLTCKGGSDDFYNTPGANRDAPCPTCNGTGRSFRACPPTAQPITRVVLTTIPAILGPMGGSPDVFWIDGDPQQRLVFADRVHEERRSNEDGSVHPAVLRLRYPGIEFVVPSGEGPDEGRFG